MTCSVYLLFYVFIIFFMLLIITHKEDIFGLTKFFSSSMTMGSSKELGLPLALKGSLKREEVANIAKSLTPPHPPPQHRGSDSTVCKIRHACQHEINLSKLSPILLLGRTGLLLWTVPTYSHSSFVTVKFFYIRCDGF